MTVLDTTALAAAMRGEPEIVSLLAALRPGLVATVPPVVAEIEYGIQRLEAGTHRRTLLEGSRDRLFGQIQVLPWIAEASVRFGALKAALERRGELIDDFDVAISAIALVHDAEVVTANLAHFRRVAGLSCRHWSQPRQPPRERGPQ
jgi:predicted nucleic acid-binding protein